MNRLHENKALLSEVRKTLDDQVDSLDFPIRSRLTQARFHAIDYGLLSSSNSFTDYGRFAFSAVAFIGVLVLTLLVATNVQEQPSSNTEITSLLPPVMIQVNQVNIDTLKTTEDTKEEIEIYNWLFDHYGTDS